MAMMKIIILSYFLLVPYHPHSCSSEFVRTTRAKQEHRYHHFLVVVVDPEIESSLDNTPCTDAFLHFSVSFLSTRVFEHRLFRLVVANSHEPYSTTTTTVAKTTRMYCWECLSGVIVEVV